MSRFNLIALGVLCAVAGLCICGGPAAAGPIGSVFNPMDYTTLDAGGGLTMSAVDTITFDTSSGAITGTIGGSPVSFGNGFTASSQSTGVQVRVFTFDSINIASGATVNVTGDLGLVLASQSDFTLNAPLIGLDGSDANLQIGGAGGAGAEGGTPGGPFGSTPPGSTRGNGGDGDIAIAYLGPGATPGVGYGGGGAPGIFTERGGGGGGYAGAGGNAPNSGGAGGVVYGDLAMTELYGGSGGGGSQRQSYGDSTRGGGGGGGALELVAVDRLSLGVGLSAVGGTDGGAAATYRCGGGGGSGGGIILAADWINFDGTVDVSGGDGGISSDVNRTGGGGGGGRVAFYADAFTGTSDTGADIDLSGGQGPGNAFDGADGTFYRGLFPHDTATTLTAVQDNYIYCGPNADKVMGSDGSSKTMEVKNDPGGDPGTYSRKIYIKFDLTGADFSPNAEAIFKFTQANYSGDGIDNGTLAIFGLDAGFVPSGVELDTDWAENLVTWNKAPGNSDTSAEFDAADATLIGTADFKANDPSDNGTQHWLTISHIGDFLQADNSLTLMIGMQSQTLDQWLGIGSSENSLAAYRPLLELSVVVPEPSGIALALFGLLALVGCRRGRK